MAIGASSGNGRECSPPQAHRSLRARALKILSPGGNKTLPDFFVKHKSPRPFENHGEPLIFSGSRLEKKRKIYVVKENKDIEIRMSRLIVNGKLQVYDEVKEGDFFTIYRKKDGLAFKAGGYIGLIPINDQVLLDVRPRVPLKNLTRMMRIAEDTPLELNPFLSYYGGEDEAVPSMIDVFARALINAVREIRFSGVHRDYIQREDDTSFPRGRVLIGETMQRHEAHGIRHRVTSAWFEPSADTAPNRCLKYAIWYLAHHYTSTGQNKSRLLQDLEEAYHLFVGAQLDMTLQFLKAATVRSPETLPSIRDYYIPALYLALLIIRNRGISFAHRKQGVLMPSLLIDLKKTFEIYLRNVLRAKLRDIESSVRVLDGNLKGTDGGAKFLFDNDPKSSKATPDIVFNTSGVGESRCLIVADTKYKDFKKPARTDIEQAVTYAACYRAPIVVIIHPRVTPTVHGLGLLGRIDPYTIYHYAFDLAANNPDREEENFARSFRDLLTA
jgi:5-methylcytosine-specific restriction enzyme subunit McrC